MPPWFSSTARENALRDAAAAWLGTPFLGNSSACGRGVSCQFLAAALYRETGFVDLIPPEVPMAYARFNTVSMVEPWMDARPEFEDCTGLPAQAGDMLGFRIGRAVHHCGVVLSSGSFVHCVDPAGVIISPLTDSTWASRLRRAWRPIAT